jgi:hypothetical protein
MAKNKVLHGGAVYYSVAGAAQKLATTQAKVREMMGLGELDWSQLRVNGPLLIPAQSLEARMRAKR